MKNHSKALSYSLIFLFSFFSFTSCKKINEATGLGNDLIPPIDNVNTFDTTIDVETYNEILLDSIRSFYYDEQFLGTINNDPLFGKTEATMFFQLKPAVLAPPAPSQFKFLFQNTGNSLINLDSVVLTLSYVETYGDSTVPQSVRVYEIDQNSSNVFKKDSGYVMRLVNFATSNAISPLKTFLPKDLNDSITLGYKSQRVANQLRIRLDNSFGTRMFGYDTSNAYKNDTLFNQNFKGFAVRPEGAGNAVVGVDLTDAANTRLAFYYRYNNGGTPTDTVQYFNFISTSASANRVTRDYSGAPINNYLGGTGEDELVFLQNTPGTFARIKIPGLSSVNNRVVHRAELIVHQIADPSDRIFTNPFYLFLDAYDPAKTAYRAIPFDLTFTNTGNFNYDFFGSRGKGRTDNAGNPVTEWNFNVTRYVQHVVNNTEPNYELRLLTAYAVNDYFRNGNIDAQRVFFLNPTTTKGRVRVAGGNYQADPQKRMRLRIIYSKL